MKPKSKLREPPYVRKSKRIIRCGVCIDMAASMSQSYEEELEQIQSCWTDFMKEIGCKISFKIFKSAYDIPAGLQLVLFDYGGMGYGNTMGEDNSRALIRFAQDNPRTLIVVISGFTWDHQITCELHFAGFAELSNVIQQTFDKDYNIWLPDWFKLEVKPPESIPGFYCKRCGYEVPSNLDLQECLTCHVLCCIKGCLADGVDCYDCTDRRQKPRLRKH